MIIYGESYYVQHLEVLAYCAANMKRVVRYGSRIGIKTCHLYLSLTISLA